MAGDIPPQVAALGAEAGTDAQWFLAAQAHDPGDRHRHRAEIMAEALEMMAHVGAVVPGAAVAEAVTAERERLYDQLGRDHHVIFQNDGWTVEHSVECRLAGDMTSGCAYWAALKRTEVTSEPDPEMLGRWRIDLDSEGLPSLTRTEASGD